MNDAQFDALVEQATAMVEPGDVVGRLDTLLRWVVRSTGEAGDRALENWCKALAAMDARNAG